MEITNGIVYLLRKHISHTLDASEQAELKAWADRHPAFRRLLDEVTDEAQLKSALKAFHAVYEEDEAGSIARMEARIAKAVAGETSIKKLRFRKWFPYAAAVLLAATAATWVFFGEELNLRSKIVNLKPEDIAPGGNRATLTLADGHVIDLSEAQTGIVINDGITYQDGSDLTLGDSTLAGIVNLQANIVNELVLTTPKGGTYQITLPDGTKVWLNAASTLKYPSRFDGDERVVELSGEAYFEVRNETPDSAPESHLKSHVSNLKSKGRPFRVVSKGQRVEVLGTQFNISAYPDESETKTTLVEGSVRIAPADSPQVGLTTNDSRLTTKVLSPGQQATTRGAQLEIKQVDTEPYTAWKDGYFYFDRLPTVHAISQLARWYDLDVVYEGKLKDVNIYGYVDRGKPLKAVLTALEDSGLKFSVRQSGNRKQLIVFGEQ